MPITLLDNVNADGNGTPQQSDGGAKLLLVSATSFGGGTVTVQVSNDANPSSIRWSTITRDGSPLQFTANGAEMLDFIPAGLMIRAVLASSSGASNVQAVLY